MIKHKLLLIISLFLLLILFSLISIEDPIITGKIDKISFQANFISMKINNTEVIIFDNYVPLKENDSVGIYGKKKEEKGKTTILVEKILLLSK